LLPADAVIRWNALPGVDVGDDIDEFEADASVVAFAEVRKRARVLPVPWLRLHWCTIDRFQVASPYFFFLISKVSRLVFV